jgi:uncharacterized protein
MVRTMDKIIRPAPIPTPETRRFWEAARDRVLCVPRCEKCLTWVFYPRPFCPKCGAADPVWTPLSGKATLHSYVINHRPPPGYGSAGAYIIAIVALAEGFRMMTNLVNVEPAPENLQLDMKLQVEFEDRGEWRVPVFRPAESDSRATEVHGEG